MQQSDAEIPILHKITPAPGPGQFCILIEKEFKAISFIDAINVARQKQGLKAIRPDNNLCNVALLHGYDQFVSFQLTSMYILTIIRINFQ